MWKAPDFPPGVARGIVAELLGNARTEWLLKSDGALRWLPLSFGAKGPCAANPVAIQQRGVSLNRGQVHKLQARPSAAPQNGS